MAFPVHLCAPSTLNVTATVLASTLASAVCPVVSAGSSQPSAVAVHDLIVPVFTSQEPDAPKGVVLMRPPFMEMDHLPSEASVTAPYWKLPPINFVTHSLPSGTSHFC